MHDFVEQHPEFKGFSKFYADHILPNLSIAEQARARAVGDGLKRLMGALFCGGVLGGFLYVHTQAWPVIIFSVGIALIIGGVWSSFALKSVRAETKHHLVGKISQFLGLTFVEKIEVKPEIVSLMAMHFLLPKHYDREDYEDRITGHAHGADFDMFEAHFQKKRTDDKGRTHWVTLFRGQVISVDFHRKFTGRTVVLRERIFQGKKRGDMKRVGLVDPVFEKIFEAYGTDQVEARYLLTPTFMQRLVDLETSFAGKRIRFGFLEGKLFIAVETKNRFEVGSMLKPLTTPERTQNILNEFGALFDIIDGVLKPQDAPQSIKT